MDKNRIPLPLRMIRGALRRLDSKLTRIAAPTLILPPTALSDNRRAESEGFFRGLLGHEQSSYGEAHLGRLIRTMTLVPPPTGAGRALELGAYMQMTPALERVWGYSEVRGAYFGRSGTVETKSMALPGSGEFTCQIDLFDAERDSFPYPDGHFATVLCCEVIEHLLADPMHMLLEIRRVLAPDGSLVLTTPNCASLTSLACALHGRDNPQVYACYPKSSSGFDVRTLFTERVPGSDDATWISDLLERNQLETVNRGEQQYCVCVPRHDTTIDRYPSWLYC